MIAFARSDNTSVGQIWVVNPDGSGSRRLTNAANVVDQDPAWSPGGGQLAFSRWDFTNCGIPCADLYVVRANRTGLKQLPESDQQSIFSHKQNFFPSWSPDGAEIAFSAGDAPGFLVAQLRTGRVRSLVPENGPLGVGSYAWSPDSKSICFDAVNSNSRYFLASHLYRVRRDGRGRTKLTAGQGIDCYWSPNGTKIAFTNGKDIVTINPDGTGLTRLTTTAARELNPVWSPDGTRIAFLRQEHGGKHAPFDLWTMAADGSEQARAARNVSGASWSPDGTMLAVVRGGRPAEAQYPTAPRPEGLWVIKADGSGQIEIAKGANEFDWQRLP